MTFFSHVEEEPAEREAPPPPARPPWRFEPDGVLPSSAPIDTVIGRSKDVVVALYGARVYPSGMAIRIGAWLRSGNKNEVISEFLGTPPERLGGPPGIQRGLMWGLEFSDRRRVTNADPYPYPEGPSGRFDADLYAHEEQVGPPDVPVLTAGHGQSGVGSGNVHQNHWLWPLPPPGPLRLACEWTARGIEETVTEIDAAPIIDAARRAQPIWP